MRRRTSKLVLAVGSGAVLAMAVVLVRLTRDAREASSPRVTDRPAVTPRSAGDDRAAPAETASHTGPVAMRDPRAAMAAPRAHVATPVRPPELAPQASFTRELKRDANGKLVPIVTVKELREQLPLSDAPMKACLERSGQHPTGTAMLNFTVGAQNNQLVIETTGVQDEETLAAYPELLECMHKTASVLLPHGRSVPELGTPIYVRRRVRIENGVLAENTIFNFSYNP